MEAALTALYRAVFARLNADPAAHWTSAHADLVPAQPAASRPYVLFFWAGGGERNRHVEPDAEIVLTVKICSGDQAGALAGKARLSALLNDAGAYDARDATVPLEGGSDWLIRTTTQERDVHQVYLVDGQPVYEEGFQLRVMMSSR